MLSNGPGDPKECTSIIEEIKKLEIANMTPLDALNTLYRMQATLKNRI